MTLGAPISTGLPVASSIALSLFLPSRSCAGDLGLARHNTMGNLSPFSTISSPSTCSSSDDISGNSAAAG